MSQQSAERPQSEAVDPEQLSDDGAGLGMGACLEALDGVAARGLAERDNDGRWRRGPVNNRPLRAAEAVRADTSNGSGVPGEPTLLDDHG